MSSQRRRRLSFIKTQKRTGRLFYRPITTILVFDFTPTPPRTAQHVRRLCKQQRQRYATNVHDSCVIFRNRFNDNKCERPCTRIRLLSYVSRRMGQNVDRVYFTIPFQYRVDTTRAEGMVRDHDSSSDQTEPDRKRYGAKREKNPYVRSERICDRRRLPRFGRGEKLVCFFFLAPLIGFCDVITRFKYLISRRGSKNRIRFSTPQSTAAVTCTTRRRSHSKAYGSERR